jgi:hypothetical protein
MDGTVLIIVIAAVVLIAAVAAVWFVSRERKRRQLKQQFGPEYERTVERTGDRRQAEQALSERVTRRQQLELRPLTPAARETYQTRWTQLQADFVDRPDAAVHDAQSLLDDVMVARGYPIGDEFEERVDLISVDHPAVAENYRDAHRLHGETRDVPDSPEATENRRQALVHYRALFADLLDGRGDTDESDRHDDAAVPDDADHDHRAGRAR